MRFAFLVPVVFLLGCTDSGGKQAVLIPDLASPVVEDAPAIPDLIVDDTTPEVVEDENAASAPPVTQVSTEPVAAQFTKVEVAVAQVEEIKATLNSEPSFAIHSEDLDLLKNEGLLDNENDLQEWVK